MYKRQLLDQFVQAGIYRTSTDNKIGGKNESENIKGSGINYGNKKESGKGNRIGNSKANGSEKEIVFKELSSDYPNHNFIMTSKGRLFVLTDNLDIVRIYEKSDLYHEVAGNGRFTLVSNNGVDLTLLDNSSAPVAAVSYTHLFAEHFVSWILSGVMYVGYQNKARSLLLCVLVNFFVQRPN